MVFKLKVVVWIWCILHFNVYKIFISDTCTTMPTFSKFVYWKLRAMWTGLILDVRPANERRHYFVTMSLIGWAQTQNRPCVMIPTCGANSEDIDDIMTLFGVRRHHPNYQTLNNLHNDLVYLCTHICVCELASMGSQIDNHLSPNVTDTIQFPTRSSANIAINKIDT